MHKNSRIPYLVMALLVAVFAIGVMRLFQLRFEAGDMYPAYSSHRADPLGTKALFLSLKKLNSLRVHRNYRALSRAHPETAATLLYLGACPARTTLAGRNDFNVLDRLARKGTRVVISFSPSWALPPTAARATSLEEGFFRRFKTRWGAVITFTPLPEGKALETAYRSSPPPSAGFPPSLSWHSSMGFRPLHKQWRVIYGIHDKAVMMERRLGHGSLVLCSDSYFFSNEALREDRHPELLAWVIGGHGAVVFDESHLGILETPGVAGLAKQYGLYWPLAGILFMAALLVWKHAVPFLPPQDQYTEEKALPYPSERDSIDGLISLLRRHIPMGHILARSFEEWEKAFAIEGDSRDGPIAQARIMISGEMTPPLRRQDPVEGYRAISRILSKEIPL